MDGSSLTLQHIVPGVNNEIPVGACLLTVRAEAENVAYPRDAKYLAQVDPLGRLVVLSGAYADLDKGLLEFKRDTVETMTKTLPEALSRVTAATTRIGEMHERLTAQILEAQSKPLTRWEMLLRIRSSEDRILRRSSRWAKEVDRATDELKISGGTYSLAAASLVQNLTGYVELAPAISESDVNALKGFCATSIETLSSIKRLHASIGANVSARVLTHVTRSMRSLSAAVEHVIQETDVISQGLEMALVLAERKLSQSNGG
jgi:hypothetical protein